MDPNMSNNWNPNNNHSGTPINSINNFSTTQYPTILATGGSSYAPYFSSGPTTPDLNVSSSSSSRTHYPSTYSYSSLHQDPAPWTTSSGSSSHQHSGGRPSSNDWVDRHDMSAHNIITAAGIGNGASTAKGTPHPSISGVRSSWNFESNTSFDRPNASGSGSGTADGNGYRNGIISDNGNSTFSTRRTNNASGSNIHRFRHFQTHKNNNNNNTTKSSSLTKGSSTSAISHAEDLQPNEGFTGVKTIGGHQPVVPKVLSTSSGNSRGRGRGRGRGRWRGQNRNGNNTLSHGWKNKNNGNGNEHGLFRYSAPTFQTSPPRSAADPIPIPIPTNPHSLPASALTKALIINSNNKNNFTIPQKRKSPPTRTGLDSGSVLSLDRAGPSSGSNGNGSGGGSHTGLDFSYLLPKGVGKRRKTQELEQEQEPVQEAQKLVLHALDEDGKQFDEMEIIDVEEQKPHEDVDVLSIPDYGSENTNDVESVGAKPLQPDSVVNTLRLEKDWNHSDGLHTTETLADVTSTNMTMTTPTTATAVKDEPFDIELPTSNAPLATSGTKRYHPIPSSCLKLFSVLSINTSSSSFPTNLSSPTSESNLNSNTAGQLIPNPHWRTARAEFANRATRELREEGLIIKRVLWRTDGMCIDWEKPAPELSSGGNRKGNNRTLNGGTEVPKERLVNKNNRLQTSSMAMMMNQLIVMDDDSGEHSQARQGSHPRILPLPVHPPRAVENNNSPQSLLPNAMQQVNGLDVDVEIIDLTVDEEKHPSPPASSSLTFGENGDNDEDDRPLFRPPLVVRLGAGRTDKSKSSRSCSDSLQPKAYSPRSGSSASSVATKLSVSPTISTARTPKATSKIDTEPVRGSSSGSSLAVQKPKLLPHALKPSSSPSYSHLHLSPFPPLRGNDTNDGAEIDENDCLSSSNSHQYSGEENTSGRESDEEMQVLRELDLDLQRSGVDLEVNMEMMLRGVIDRNDGGILGEVEVEMEIETEDSDPGELLNHLESSGHGFSTEQGLEGLESDMYRLKMEGLAIEFLKRYLQAWENDRPALVNAYAPNAVFSCSAIISPAFSETTLGKSPTHEFTSQFVASTSKFASTSTSSSTHRSRRRPPVPIQTPAVISPALLLLDPEHAYTFFPPGEQAKVDYDALYLGDVVNSPTSNHADHSECKGDLVFLGVQAELDRRLPEAPRDDVLDVPTKARKEKEQSEVDKVFVSWNFVLCTKPERGSGRKGRSENDQHREFPLQIISHQMVIRDQPPSEFY